jgi:hypothetical protein
VQDFALLREQVVIDAEAVEGAKVGVHDRRRHDFAHFCGVTVALFDFFEGLSAKLEARFVFREPLRDAGVQVPTEVVEPGRGGQGFHFGERFFFEMDKAEDDIGNLDARIVDVVLDFN